MTKSNKKTFAEETKIKKTAKGFIDKNIWSNDFICAQKYYTKFSIVTFTQKKMLYNKDLEKTLKPEICINFYFTFLYCEGISAESSFNSTNVNK